jgi:hypothetical protein
MRKTTMPNFWNFYIEQNSKKILYSAHQTNFSLIELTNTEFDFCFNKNMLESIKSTELKNKKIDLK